ncbi:aldo/keto reductase [Promicromonospora vindobonensis]|uniref:Aldo/keto reductase n=1 Tax=Promicromonospora vindobonensis TaxID=195748 RepID=A0ABW5W1P1_9MICO
MRFGTPNGSTAAQVAVRPPNRNLCTTEQRPLTAHLDQSQKPGQRRDNERTREAYRALERLLAAGRVRAISVSNFMPHHLDALMESATVTPAVNQVELHPYFSQPDVQAADAARGILTQAWSPIGGITFYPGYGEERKSVLEDGTIQAIAKQHGKSPAQVMLRRHGQRGRSAIPKSTNPNRIAENFAVFDFELTGDELAAIDGLDTGRRGGPDPDTVDPVSFGLEIPEP